MMTTIMKSLLLLAVICLVTASEVTENNNNTTTDDDDLSLLFHDHDACGSLHPDMSTMRDDFLQMQHFDEYKSSEAGMSQIVSFVNYDAYNMIYGPQNAAAYCVQCITIPVFFHVIMNNVGSQGKLTDQNVQDQMNILNAAFQNSPFFFDLVQTIRISDTSLFSASNYGYDIPSQQAAIGHKHRKGDRKTLNIYTIQSIYNSLGSATFPFGFNGDKDGVFIDYCTVPKARCHMPFSLNSGEVLVHETGHWLGLLHTFNGGCDDAYGDYVSDTHAQAYTADVFKCVDPPMDTCPDNTGLDPLDNYMGYSFRCMNTFTEGQLTRMYDQWMVYRENQGCKLNEGVLRMELKLDEHPEDNYWRLYHANNGALISISEFGESDEYMVQNGQLCLNYNTPYYFGLFDQDGNGLNATDSYYKLFFDNTLLLNDAGVFQDNNQWSGLGFTMVDPHTGCSYDESILTIHLTLHDRPSDIVWSVHNDNDFSTLYTEQEYLLRGSDLFYQRAVIVRQMCVQQQQDTSYTMIIEDLGADDDLLFGDGSFSDSSSSSGTMTTDTTTDKAYFRVSIDDVVVQENYVQSFDIVTFTVGNPSETGNGLGNSTATTTTTPSQTPSLAPSDSPSVGPSERPSAAPLNEPSSAPSVSPSASPSAAPSDEPSESPSASPSEAPSSNPSSEPTIAHSLGPSAAHSSNPSSSPTSAPTTTPSESPSKDPSSEPSESPSASPSIVPTSEPTIAHSLGPSAAHSSNPSSSLTSAPTTTPSESPSKDPSSEPSESPSASPSIVPTSEPTIAHSLGPSAAHSSNPSSSPTSAPTTTPSESPSKNPSSEPSESPSASPSEASSSNPSSEPTIAHSLGPSAAHSSNPSSSPTSAPTTTSSESPSKNPSSEPSESPSASPSIVPTFEPTIAHSLGPSAAHSLNPSSSPSFAPTITPSGAPSRNPTSKPSESPSASPTIVPSNDPTSESSDSPSETPSVPPSVSPSSIPTVAHSLRPSAVYSTGPSSAPTVTPSDSPSSSPSSHPSDVASMEPTNVRSQVPTSTPSSSPSTAPTLVHSLGPSIASSEAPTFVHSSTPSVLSSVEPTSSPSIAPSEAPSTLSMLTVKSSSSNATSDKEIAVAEAPQTVSPDDVMVVAYKFAFDLQVQECITVLQLVDTVTESLERVTNDLFMLDLPLWDESTAYKFIEELEFLWSEKMAVYQMESALECQKVDVTNCKYHVENTTYALDTVLFRSTARHHSFMSQSYRFVVQPVGTFKRLQSLGYHLPMDTLEIDEILDCDSFLATKSDLLEDHFTAPFTMNMPERTRYDDALQAWTLFADIQQAECEGTKSRYEQVQEDANAIEDRINLQLLGTPSFFPALLPDDLQFYQTLEGQTRVKVDRLKRRTQIVCKQAEYGRCQRELAKANVYGDLLYRRIVLDPAQAREVVIGQDPYEYVAISSTTFLDPRLAFGYEVVYSCTELYDIPEY